MDNHELESLLHHLLLTLEENGQATFFDSYGLPPDFSHYPSDIVSFLKDRSLKISYHIRQLQNTLSTVCGQQCVYYLCHRACGMSLQQVLSSYSDDVLKNDVMVSNFVKKYQRCIRKQNATSFHHGACSLQMFKDCYKL